MKAFLTVVKRELASVAQERTIMIAIVIQLFIASFSSAILIGLLSFYDPASIAETANARITAGILGDHQSELVNLLRQNDIRPLLFTSAAQAEQSLSVGSIDALVYIPQYSGSTTEIQLFLPEGEARATVSMMILREPLKEFENQLRSQNGLSLDFLDIRGKYPTTFEFLYATIVPILMLFPGFVAGSMVVDSISSEFEQNTLETILASPLTLNRFFWWQDRSRHPFGDDTNMPLARLAQI